ncbi:MAG: hypothetical protein AAB374_02245 [Patescibacteria group bacterium]
MRHLAIIGVWFVVFIADGIVFPALTGLPSGFGIMVLLSVLAITFGVHRWVIGLGIIFAGITELIIGTYFGTIIGAWLAMAWVWHLLNQFLNLKSMNENDSLVALAPFILLGLGLFAFGEGVSWMIIHFVYESELTAMFFDIFLSPAILSIVAVEFAITFFVFRFIYFSRNAG